MDRQPLAAIQAKHPELLPKARASGYSFHARYYSVKQPLDWRHIKRTATGQVLQIRPSLVLPYRVGRTEALEKARRWRRWGVPFEELAYPLGRHPRYSDRAGVALGRVSLVGPTVKAAERWPRPVVADAKHPWVPGKKP